MNKLDVIIKDNNFDSKEKISSMIEQYTNDEVCEKYNKKAVESMYYIVYGFPPRAKYSKIDIIHRIRGYFHSIERDMVMLSSVSTT